MPAPPPTSPEIYNSLVSLLSPLTPQVFELDVLPSYFPAEIHSTSSAIALPKPLLASLFLTAHHVFFSYLNTSSSSQREKKQHQTTLCGGTPILLAPAYYAADDALQATKIILLWDPNHLTAANFRKKHLLSLSPSPSSSNDLIQHLKAELSFLTSLLTSPLPKHTKSSTLWSHRSFLFSKFGHEISSSLSLVAAATTTTTRPPEKSSDSNNPCNKETPFIRNLNNNNNDDDDDNNDNEHINSNASDYDGLLHLLWLHELEIIMKAGDRHPKNYYAWSYARQLLTALSTGRILPSSFSSSSSPVVRHQIGTKKNPIDDDATRTRMNQIAAKSIFQVHKWCLAHPRDISGWTFLEYLLMTGLGWERELEEGRAGAEEEEEEEDGMMMKCCEGEGEGLEESRAAAKGGRTTLGENGISRKKGKEDVDEIVRRVVKDSEDFVNRFQWKGDSLAWFLRAMGSTGVMSTDSLNYDKENKLIK